MLIRVIGEDSVPATARVLVTVRDVNEHPPDIHFENTGTGSDVRRKSETETGNDVTRGESGRDVTYYRVPDIHFETTGTGSDVRELVDARSESETGSDVSGAAVVEVEEGVGEGEFVAHLTVFDRDSGGHAGRVHCTMPSSHFTLVRIYSNDYKVYIHRTRVTLTFDLLTPGLCAHALFVCQLRC